MSAISPYRLTKLARDAPLLARGVSSQDMLASESRADGTFLEGVVDLHAPAP